MNLDKVIKIVLNTVSIYYLHIKGELTMLIKLTEKFILCLSRGGIFLLSGLIAETVGAGSVKVSPLARVALCPSGLMTVTSTAPTACAGADTVRVVELTKVTLLEVAVPKTTVGVP